MKWALSNVGAIIEMARQLFDGDDGGWSLLQEVVVVYKDDVA
jgi:hypothetical protein